MENEYMPLPRFFNVRVEPVIGEHVKLNNALLDCAALVTIEDCAFFGHDVLVLTGSHDYNQFGIDRQEAIIAKPITIKRGAWIASRAVILQGITIGEHSVVGAGSVVTKDVAPYAVVHGNPARTVKQLTNHP